MTVSESDFLRHVSYLSAPDQEFVAKALARAKELHNGQSRDSGLPYVTHPIAVADYLASLEADKVTLVAALLHDVVEDDRVSIEQLEKEFGPEVVKLVDGVTKLSKIYYEGRGAERQVASLRKLLLIAAEDLRVILIKLADRWHNVETISGLRSDKQTRVANETLDIYVPFARLMGLYELKSRFEEVCFPLAFPVESKVWHDAIAAERQKIDTERKAFVDRINAETDTHVTPVLVRSTDYELYKKLQGNMSRLSESQNIDSVVLVVDRPEPQHCYEVLGQIHMRYPVRGLSFKDHISNPQPNGYKAVHTVIFLSRSHQVLLRIQTKKMYEFGTKRKMSSWVSNGSAHFASVLSSLSHVPFEKERFLTDLQSNVLSGRINVFTTSGEVVNLPKDATGIDFTFAVNPDHIAFLAGIRLNGEVKEATATLEEGDTAEPILLDAKNPAVRAHWMEKTKSIEAREALKKDITRSPREKQYAAGKEIVEVECRKRALPVWWLFHYTPLQRALALSLGRMTFEEVIVGIGVGEIPVGRLIETYKQNLLRSQNVIQRILKFFNLLPTSRVLNKEATIVDLEIYAEDRKGLIYDITRVIAERDINISKFGVFALPPKDALYKTTLEFEKFDVFSDLFDALLHIPNVKRVLRKT